MTAVAVEIAPEPVTVTRWRCPFCRRSRAHKKATTEHIARCWLNPAVRSCKTCVNFEPGGDACGCEPGAAALPLPAELEAAGLVLPGVLP